MGEGKKILLPNSPTCCTISRKFNIRVDGKHNYYCQIVQHFVLNRKNLTTLESFQQDIF